jgi:hypothetical protein
MFFPGVGTLVGGAIGAGVGAFGAYESGQAQKKAYTYQAGVAQINKQIADQNARYAIETGESRAQIAGMQTRAQIGETKAIQGASGLAVNKGSTVDVRASEANIGEENEMTIRSNAAREAYGYKVQGVADTAQATLDTAAAKTSSQAGTIGAVSSLLGGATSVSSRWTQFAQQGVFGGGSGNATAPWSYAEGDEYA